MDPGVKPDSKGQYLEWTYNTKDHVLLNRSLNYEDQYLGYGRYIKIIRECCLI